MKRIALSVVLCLAFASLSFAQQNPADAPASKDDVEKFLDALHTRDLMKSTMDAMRKQMHQIIHQQVQSDQNLPIDFEVRLDKMMDAMLADLPLDELVDAMIPVYQKHFTKGDMDALVAFYSTPAGQKYVKELPALTSEAMQASSGVVQKMMAKMMSRVREEIAQAERSGDSNSTSKPQQN
jgi:hypothetical protein